MTTAGRSYCLESKDIIDELIDDDDSDIEEARNIQIEEVIQDLQEVVSVQDQENVDADISDNISEPEHGQGRGRSRNTLRRNTSTRSGRGRLAARTSTRGRASAATHSIWELDEGNRWSYQTVQQPPENPVFQEVPRVLAPIDENSTQLDCFLIFFPDSFWNLLKIETNRYAAQMKAKQTRQGILKPGTMLYEWKPVKKHELKTFFSIVIHMTLVHKESFDSYWSTREIIETPFAKKHMTRNRFRAIYSCLHLNDNANYKPRFDPEYDAFFKLRPFFDELCLLCQNSFYPNENLTIDEGTCGFRGRVHCRVYNKDKPDKYGMKVYMLCDAETGYILRMVPYSIGDSKSIATIITELSEPYFGKWHTIYMDRFFTSPTIADILWIKDTRIVGTVMANRRDLPQDWRQKPLEKDEMAFCHRGNLTACKWKDKRDVLMLTTKHAASWSEVDAKAKGVGVTKRLKPDCILDYNHHKIGVDLNNQYVSYCSLNRKSMKWWKKMFFNLVARALVNAYVIYNKSKTQRRRPRFSQFLINCGEQLLETAPAAEPGPSHGPHYVGKSTRLVGRHFMERIPSTENKEKVARVCKVCADISKKRTGKRGRKETIFYCPDCNVPLCYYPCFKLFHTRKDYTC